MHYKNGREAKNGDKVVVIPSYGMPRVGLLFDAVPGNDACNGALAEPVAAPTYVNLAETLHLDDVLAAIAKAPELQPAAKPAQTPPSK